MRDGFTIVPKSRMQRAFQQPERTSRLLDPVVPNQTDYNQACGYGPAACAARRQAVDLSGEACHLSVGHGTDARLRRGGADAEGLQLVAHFAAADQISELVARALRLRRSNH